MPRLIGILVDKKQFIRAGLDTQITPLAAFPLQCDGIELRQMVHVSDPVLFSEELHVACIITGGGDPVCNFDEDHILAVSGDLGSGSLPRLE